jgi:hypothetical protein
VPRHRGDTRETQVAQRLQRLQRLPPTRFRRLLSRVPAAAPPPPPAVAAHVVMRHPRLRRRRGETGSVAHAVGAWATALAVGPTTVPPGAHARAIAPRRRRRRRLRSARARRRLGVHPFAAHAPRSCPPTQPSSPSPRTRARGHTGAAGPPSGGSRASSLPSMSLIVGMFWAGASELRA